MSDKITRRCCNDSAPHEPDEENGYLIDIEDIAALDAEYAERMTNVHFVKNPDHRPRELVRAEHSSIDRSTSFENLR